MHGGDGDKNAKALKKTEYVYSQSGKCHPAELKKKVPHFDSCASQAQPITTVVTIDRYCKSDSKAKSSILQLNLIANACFN